MKKQKNSKVKVLEFHWIQDRVKKGEFITEWSKGPYNLADFPSKIHPVHHFNKMVPTLSDILPRTSKPTTSSGCVHNIRFSPHIEYIPTSTISDQIRSDQ